MSHDNSVAPQAKEQKPVITPALINEAREKVSVATMLLLSPDGGRSGDKAFYANLLMRMNIMYDDKTPTAGVWVTERVNLSFNPHFVVKLTIPEIMELIIHECEHIMNLHPMRAKKHIADGYNKNTHRLFNIATDANINENLPVLTRNLGVTIDRINDELKSKGLKQRLDRKDFAEIHFEKLKAAQDELPEKMEGEGEIDDHSTWDDSTESEEVAKAVVREAANKAAEATGAGNMPHHIAQAINALNKAQVCWRKQMQQFAVRSLKFERERTRSKPNRRTGLMNPGKRKKPLVRIVVITDESGSVSDNAHTQFFSEIDAIAGLGISITVLACDTVVAAEYEYKKGMKVERKACGGTMYVPGINRAKELKADGIVFFGDMDSADTPTDPKIPFLWCAVGNQKPPGNFGKVIRITEGKE